MLTGALLNKCKTPVALNIVCSFFSSIIKHEKIIYLPSKIIMHPFKILLTAGFIVSALLCFSQAIQQKTLKTDSLVYAKVEVEAAYPGGNEAWQKYVQKNMSPKVPTKEAPVGKYQAIAIFMVAKDGSVNDVKPLTNFGYGMEEEVIRVIETSGKWIPAMQNYKPVNAFRKQPVTFIIGSADFKIITTEPYTLYTNTDNEISISARKVKAADIGINVQGGSGIPAGDGKFIVKVKKTGRVIIEIVNTKKNDASIGEASFEVKAK
jgi:hypothetical protein